MQLKNVLQLTQKMVLTLLWLTHHGKMGVPAKKQCMFHQFQLLAFCMFIWYLVQIDGAFFWFFYFLDILE